MTRLQWTQVPKDDVRGQWAALYVTMNPKGRIAMSRVTYQRMGAPEAFHVLFDATNNVIGLKPTVLAMRNAYRACVTSGKNVHGGKAIHAYRLIEDYNIRLPQTIRFHDAEIDQDGILRLDLRTAKVSERSIGHYRRFRERTPDGKYPDVIPSASG